MLQWVIIGLVIWYFYRNYQKRKAREIEYRNRYLRDEEFRSEERNPHPPSDNEDEYIDYEEVR